MAFSGRLGAEPSHWEELSFRLAGSVVNDASQKLANRQLAGEEKLEALRLRGGFRYETREIRQAMRDNTGSYQEIKLQREIGTNSFRSLAKF